MEISSSPGEKVDDSGRLGNSCLPRDSTGDDVVGSVGDLLTVRCPGRRVGATGRTVNAVIDP